MIFSKERPVKIVMIGAGGTGGHIAPHLYRLLYALERPVKFIVCDGDIVEEKNLVRQNFTETDLGLNKARVVAERYSSVFGLETSYVPDFIESAEKLEELTKPDVLRVSEYSGKTVTELVILIGAVDNNRSRQLCHEVFLKAENLVYIDSGNGEYTGQVVCGVRRGGKTYYPPIGTVYPDVSVRSILCGRLSIRPPDNCGQPHGGHGCGNDDLQYPGSGQQHRTAGYLLHQDG